jgi:hypothetical protein
MIDIELEKARALELRQQANEAATQLLAMLSDKGCRRFRYLAQKLITLAELDAGAAQTVLHNAELDTNRIIKRRTVPAEMERVELLVTSGPNIEFTGSLIHREEYSRQHDGMTFAAEIWETQASEWVAVWESDGHITARHLLKDDAIGAMEFWEWGIAARTLARKLKWNLRVEIE